MKSVKKQAAYNTLKVVVTGLACGVIIPLLLTYVPLFWIGMGIMSFVMVFLIKMVYDFECDRLERLEKLNG